MKDEFKLSVKLEVKGRVAKEVNVICDTPNDLAVVLLKINSEVLVEARRAGRA